MSVNTFEVDLQGQDLRIGIVQSRFNEEICRGLLNACLGELKINSATTKVLPPI